MMYISFAAALIGLAGIAGGIETGNMAGIMASTAAYIGGFIGMAEAVKKEGETDENQEDNGADPDGGSSVDKPSGQCGREP